MEITMREITIKIKCMALGNLIEKMLKLTKVNEF